MIDRCARYPDEADEADRAYIDSFSSLPDGAFVEGLVSVVSYVTPDGQGAWAVHTNCDLPASQAIGLLFAASVELMARTPGMVTNLSHQMEDDD